MKENKPYLVFFARQGEQDRYHILLSGRETDIYVTRRDIMKILTTTQFKDFVKEAGIYEVERDILKPYLTRKPQKDERERWKPQ